MNNNLIVCSIILLVSGCASTKYGYSLDEWNNLTQQERDEVKTTATSNAETTRVKQREKEFVYKPVNVIFGTRSNAY